MRNDQAEEAVGVGCALIITLLAVIGLIATVWFLFEHVRVI